MTPEKMKEKTTASTIFDSISIWNIFLIAVMIVGFLIQNSSFRTHATDFEASAVEQIKELKAKDKDLEKRLRPVENSIGVIANELKNLHKDFEKIDEKLDRALHLSVPGK